MTPFALLPGARQSAPAMEGYCGPRRWRQIVAAMVAALGACTLLPHLASANDPAISPQDCLPYNPAALHVVNLGASGWELTDGSSSMNVLDNYTDAANALAQARRHTAHCFIGRDNHRSNRSDYVHDYWTGSSGINTTISPEDCIGYSPSTLKIVDQGATGWLLTDGSSAMMLLDNQVDAGNAKTLASGFSKQCFIGRDNHRSNRRSYILEYWAQPTDIIVIPPGGIHPVPPAGPTPTPTPTSGAGAPAPGPASGSDSGSGSDGQVTGGTGTGTDAPGASPGASAALAADGSTNAAATQPHSGWPVLVIASAGLLLAGLIGLAVLFIRRWRSRQEFGPTF